MANNLVKFLSNPKHLLLYYTHCTLTLGKNVNITSKEGFSNVLNKLRLSNCLDNKDMRHSLNLSHKKNLLTLFPQNDLISPTELIDSLIALINEKKKYRKCELHLPFENIDQYVAKMIRDHLCRCKLKKNKPKSGVYDDEFYQHFHNMNKIRSAKYILNYFQCVSDRQFEGNNCYIGLLSNTMFAEIKETLSKRNNNFVILNHHQHSFTKFVIYFENGFEARKHRYIKTFLSFLELILWRISFFQLFFYFRGAGKKFYRKEDVFEMYHNVIDLESIIQLSTQSELDVNYKNKYGLFSDFEAKKKHILISDNSIRKLGLDRLYNFKSSGFRFSNYNSKIKEPARHISDKNLKLVRTFKTKLLDSMNFVKGHDSSYLITNFRLLLAKNILQFIGQNLNQYQLIENLKNLKTIIFEQIYDIHLRTNYLALLNSMIKSIRNFKKNKARTSLEEENINRIGGLPVRLISKKSNLKESLDTFDNQRKKRLVENLKKQQSLFHSL